MISSLSIEEATEQLARIVERLDQGQNLTIQITQGGKSVMALLSWKQYESISETLAIMSDPELMAALRQSADDIAEGRTTDWEIVKAEFGL